MSKYLFIILLFCFSNSFSQDYPSANYARWEYGSSGYSLKSFKIDILNNSPYLIKEIKMRVWIYDDVGEYYEHNKIQTFKVNIQGNELGTTPSIALSNANILRYWKSFEGMSWGAEILDVKFYKTPDQIAEEKLLAQEAIEEERKRLEQIELERKIQNLHSIAIEFYKSNKLYEALNYFKEVLNLNPNHADSKQKLDEIEKFLLIRSGIGYVYREENSKSLNNLKREITNILNTEINNIPDGSFRFKVIIQFDTNGINSSRIEGLSYETISQTITNILKSNVLLPPRKFNYFVNSNDSFIIDAYWNSTEEKVVSNRKGINGVDKYSKINPNNFTDYIKTQPYQYGRFTFDVKSKTLTIDGNQQDFRDIRLIHYKLNAGPQNAFYSLIFPGWGANKVSSGEKQFLTGFAYVLTGGIALLAKGINELYKLSYQEADSQIEADATYESYNAGRKLFLVSLGAVGIIYVSDFTWTLVKGFGNIKKSSFYRKKLKQGPIDVKISNF